MSDQIKGRVARILNSREIAINRGAEHGVETGMRFVVLSEMGEDIEDPDTGEVLGSIYRPKVEVEIISVTAKLSIGRTFRKHRRNLGGSGIGSLGKAFEPPKWVSVTETLKTQERSWQDISESESYVKTGDPVEQVIDDVDGSPSVRAAEIGEEI
jgi:hypothetical protein